MSTDSWNPSQYEKFKKERSQPFYDLLSLVKAMPSPTMIDLGCGTGELTAHAHQQLKAQSTLGIDSSSQMLAECKKFESKTLSFKNENIRDWNPQETFDIVISNAALQWCEGHDTLFNKIKNSLRPHGQMAIQMPYNFDYPTHILAKTMSHEEPWKAKLKGDVYDKSPTMLTPEQYATLLYDLGFKQQRVYLNVYGHELASRDDVVAWVQGTTLTHFKSRLSAADYEIFIKDYTQRVFIELPNKNPFFFPFKRIFIWGQL